MKAVSIQEVEYLAFKLAQEMLAYDEPIPDFSTRFPDRLESSLAVPFMTFDGRDLYPTLVSKASVLFYLMIKNHPFRNGNKRIALTTLFLFLYKNKKWLRVADKDLYQFSIMIAKSESNIKNEIIELIEKFFNAFMADWDS